MRHAHNRFFVMNNVFSQATVSMALDAGFRADALAYGMAKHLIAMLNGSDHQVASP